MKAAARLCAAALSAAGITSALSAEDVCDISRAAPLEFTLESVAGEEVTFSDYAGSVILVNFWATWCAPCRVEIPFLVELYEQHAEAGFVVLGVSVSDAVSALEPFVAELGMTYPVLVGAGRDDLLEAFGTPVGFPTSFVISRAGDLCRRHIGLVDEALLEREIRALLDEER